MRTLVEDGWRLVRKGMTTPAEVMRVSKDEDGCREVMRDDDRNVSKVGTDLRAVRRVASGGIDPETAIGPLG